MIAELCADFGISRKTGHKYLQRYEAEGRAGLNLNSAVKLAIFHNLLLHKAFQNWLDAPKGAPSHFGNTF